MADNFIAVHRDEMNFRLKMENDIIKDSEVIMGAIQDKLEELVQYIKAEEHYTSA